MKKHFFAQFWKWLTERRHPDYADWRSMSGDKPQETSSSEAQGSAPAATEPATEPMLPLGARFRKPAPDYSLTVGQLEELNRLLKTIRPLPQGALRVMQELNQADSSASSVAEVIQCEPVMAATMVRIANSSAIGLRREITAVSEAVAYLGFSTTRSLLMKFNIDALLHESRPGKGYDSGKLWVHAIAVAQVAEDLARRCGGADTNLTLMAGLLHDIGKLAINSKYAKALDGLWSPEADPNEGLLNRERRLFQADHAVIGGTLSTEWKLPQDLTQIIQLHHRIDALPEDLGPQARRPLLCVFLANQIVKHFHVYCDAMEIDLVGAWITPELGLPEFPQLLADGQLRTIIDRAIQQNSGSAQPATQAA